MKFIYLIALIFLISACSTVKKDVKNEADIQPEVFTGGMHEYCRIRISGVELAASQRDMGLNKDSLIKSIEKTVKTSPGKMALIKNALYLAYEQPKLTKSTLKAIEKMRCTRFSSGYGDISDKETVSYYSKFLSCQSASKDSAELYKCILGIVWPNSKVKIVHP